MYNDRPIAGFASLLEMCVGTVSALRSIGKSKDSGDSVFSDLAMSAPILLDMLGVQRVDVLLQGKNEISVMCCSGSDPTSKPSTHLTGMTQCMAPEHSLAKAYSMQASVLNMDITDDSPCESHLGYMLPNINEMVSLEDGYAIDPVHLAMSFGSVSYTHLTLPTNREV